MYKFLARFAPTKSKTEGSSKKFSNDSNLKYLLGEPGEEAIVDQMIEGPHKTGRVRFRGSWWPAKCQKEVTLLPGEIVHVVGIRDITLLVEPSFSV